MLYPVVIQKDPDSDFGVVVPDLPGCISAGKTPEEALRMAREAMELHIEGMIEDKETIPAPTSFTVLTQSAEYKGGTWAMVEIDLDKLMGPAERINITVPRFALRRIDAAAEQMGMNRSQFLVSAALTGSQQSGKAKL